MAFDDAQSPAAALQPGVARDIILLCCSQAPFIACKTAKFCSGLNERRKCDEQWGPRFSSSSYTSLKFF
jgi:hypothetical protein